MPKIFSVVRCVRCKCVFLFWLGLSVAVSAVHTPIASAQEKAGSDITADAISVGIDVGKLSEATAALQSLVDDQRIAGAVIMVSHQGKVVLADAVGLGRVDPKQPMELDSIFRIYSMTKAVTSIAVMQLVEQGKLELDAPISKYLPELASLQVESSSANDDSGNTAVASPTLRDLLRHTSGLTYGIFGDTPVDLSYRNAGILDPRETSQQMVEKLGKLSLLYPPSTKFHYSVSTDVLGRLVEVASGNTLDVQFETAIFEPLGMHDTGFYVPADKMSRFVDNFGAREGGGLRTIDQATASQFSHKPVFLSGGGGLVSTAGDYMKLCQMLCGHGELRGVRLLTETTVRDMTRNQLPESAVPIEMNGQKRVGVGFGLGFSVVMDPIPGFESVPVGEYGWGGAASTHYWISPKQKLAVVVLSQIMPFSFQCESAVKPIIYDAISRE